MDMLFLPPIRSTLFGKSAVSVNQPRAGGVESGFVGKSRHDSVDGENSQVSLKNTMPAGVELLSNACPPKSSPHSPVSGGGHAMRVILAPWRSHGPTRGFGKTLDVLVTRSMATVPGKKLGVKFSCDKIDATDLEGTTNLVLKIRAKLISEQTRQCNRWCCL
jgi:hypothetical protein